MRAYGRAIAIFEKLAAANPSVTEFRANLAQADVNMGFMQRDSGHPDQAIESFRKALSINQELAQANPSITAFSSNLATCLNNLGDLQRQAGHASGALQAHTRALSIFQKLVDSNPGVIAFQDGLASSHNYIGIVRSQSACPERRPPVVREFPWRSARKWLTPSRRTLWFLSDLANSHSNIGYLERDTGRPAQAIESFERALEILQKLTIANPAVAHYRSNLALCQINVGQLKQQIGHPAEALQLFRQALALKERLPRHGPESIYDMACLLSQMSAIAEPTAGEPMAESPARKISGGLRGALSESLSDRAMPALRDAVAAGYRDWKHMAKDSDLDSLRSRADFQLLMMDLAFPADPLARQGRAR